MSRRARALAAGALVCALAVAGCASSGSSQPGASGSTAAASPSAPATSSAPAGSNSPAGAGSPSPAAGPHACATSALQVKQGGSDGYAGGVYQTILFTNSSGRSCTLAGYPGVSLVTGPPYKQLGAAARRDTSQAPQVVTLAPGATASAVVQIVDALNFPSPSCQPAKAAALKVYPPGQFTAVYLPDTSYGCATATQTMFIAPVRPGSASP